VVYLKPPVASYSEGVNSVIGWSGPPRADQKKGLKFIAKRIRKEAV